MASLSFIIGIIGNIISILVFASPIGTFWRVVRKKSTENYKGVPYITTLLSTSLWTFYGLLKPGGLLIVTVNGVGAVLQFIYVTLFLIYAPKDTKVKSMKLVGVLDVGFLGSVIAVTLLAIRGSLRLTFVGILCAALTIADGDKNKECGVHAIFPLIFPLPQRRCLVNDYYVGIPNAVGFVLGSAQLLVYLIYKKRSASAKSKEEMEEEEEEEGSAHLVGKESTIEMQGLEEEEDHPKINNRTLNKGRSLPKSSVSRPNKFLKKALSFSPYGLHSTGFHHENDVEGGGTKELDRP